jgi:CII-binding regulator of phage lambda lysogenization HflD
MAKNKEKILDVVERKEKVSKEHLDEMLAIANKINALQFNIGRLEQQKHKILHELALGNDTISTVQDKMMKEYGSYDINLTDGTINWPKDEDEK